jgi:hypothetical protein
MTRKIFCQILAFTQPNLQTSFVDNFFLEYSLARFIHLKEKIHGYIYNHQVLGAHTSLVIFDSRSETDGETNTTATHLFWAHVGRRPFGHAAPLQCADCLSLKPWKPALKDAETITHTCRNCGKVKTYKPISDATQVKSPGPKSQGEDERGTWWVKNV